MLRSIYRGQLVPVLDDLVPEEPQQSIEAAPVRVFQVEAVSVVGTVDVPAGISFH